MNLGEFRKTELWAQLVTDDGFAGGTAGWWDSLTGFVTYFLVYQEWVLKENLAYPGPTMEEVLQEATRDLPKLLATEICEGMEHFLNLGHIHEGGYSENPWVYTWGGKLLPALNGIQKIEKLLREQRWEAFPPNVVSSVFVSEMRNLLQNPECANKWGPPTSLHDFWEPWFNLNTQKLLDENAKERREEIERRRHLLNEY